MTFTRLGDEFPGMAQGLSDAAFRMHVEALVWSNARDLDLLVPHRDIPRFTETRAPQQATVDELVDSGWWFDIGTVYDIGVVDEERTRAWQYTRAQRLEQRRKARERQAKSRDRKRETSETSTPYISALPNPTQPNPSKSA